MKIRNLLFVGLLFTLLAGAVAFAQEDNSAHSEKFDSQYAHAKCKADFTVGVIDSLTKNVQGLALSQNADKLTQDLTKLQDASTAGDKEKFKDVLKTFDSDLKDTNTAIKEARKTGNISNETKAVLKTAYEGLHETYNGCSFESLKKVANNRVEQYTEFLDKRGEDVKRLAAKGLDTAGMSKVIDDAKAQVVEPLKAAINAANDSKSLKEATKKYCLHDGCKEGVNFHFAVKFELAKLDAMVAKVRAETNSTNSSARLDAVQKVLDDARSLINTIGTSEYKGQQGAQVKQKLNEAAKLLQGAYKDTRKEAQERKKAEAKEKKEAAAEKKRNATKELKNKTTKEEVKEIVKEKKEAASEAKTTVKESEHRDTKSDEPKKTNSYEGKSEKMNETKGANKK